MEVETDNPVVAPPTRMKKPLSPYMLFIQKYKAELKPDEKFGLKTVAQVWNSLEKAEKDIYNRQHQQLKAAYSEYLQKCVDQDIDVDQQEHLDFAFPTSRIKAIMKQDPNVTCKAQTVLSMNKATEYFGEHLIAIIKRNIGGKKKVQVKDLWDAINTDKSLMFLQPIIDDYSRNSKDPKKHISLQTQKGHEKELQPPKQKPAFSGKRLPEGQAKLSDMWK